MGRQTMPEQEETTSQVVAAVERRYSDAYIVAATIVGFGDTIKALGVGFAAILLVIALIVGTKGIGGVLIALMIAVAAVGIGIVLYFLGIVVAAQGQILKASLDTAVNSSPFLPDAARARIMTLPSPHANAQRAANPQVSSVSWPCA